MRAGTPGVRAAGLTAGRVRAAGLIGTRTRAAGLIAAAAVMFFVGRADAKVLELYLQAQGGGIYGIYGTEKYDPARDPSPADSDFFKIYSGGSFGLHVGAEVFFIEIAMDFMQFYTDKGLSANLVCILLGFDWDFPISRRWEITPYVYGGFALATYSIDWLRKRYPQISRGDLQGRGGIARLGARLEFKLHEMFRIGVEGGGGYHYMFQEDSYANDQEGHSHGFHAYIMGIIRFQWEPFKKKKKKKEEIVVPVIKIQPAPPAPTPPAPAPTPPAPAPTPESRPPEQPRQPEQPGEPEKPKAPESPTPSPAPAPAPAPSGG